MISRKFENQIFLEYDFDKNVENFWQHQYFFNNTYNTTYFGYVEKCVPEKRTNNAFFIYKNDSDQILIASE